MECALQVTKVIRIFLVFATMLSLPILDSNKKLLTGYRPKISSEKIEPFDTNLEPTMSMIE